MVRAALAVGSLGVAMAMQAPARGVVVDASGHPVQFAVVFSWWQGDRIETDAAGAFAAEPGQYRVLADGYAPQIVSSAAFVRPIVLRPASTPRRDLPRCHPDARDRDVGNLRIPAPAGIRVARGGDDDSVSTNWFRGEAELRHAHGPTMTGGLPLESVLAELTDVDDRDVRLVLGPGDQDVFPLTDVRGRLPNGRRYRYVGYFGEMFEYSNLTAADAASFDRMLDAMCFVIISKPDQQPSK
jgi:hypothetical protein